MATNDSISKETLAQICKALRGIALQARSITHLTIAVEDSATGADGIEIVSANCTSIDALANQIGYLADVCLGKIDETAATTGAESWFGITLNGVTQAGGNHHG